jgi:UDP-glucose 4-epimerase|tara:strand:+ start:261 stop:1166 length:906 start_codon:yes stop_codon:yes gene_type:complete
MKVFITGGSGFIGSYLVKRLLEQGHEVKVLDLRKPNIKHKNLEFVNKSIMDELAEDILGCDVVYHFAAMLGVDNSDNKPLDTMRINLEGSVNVFKSAVEANVKRMIYASSSEVYGEPRELPIREDSVKGPISTYGVSKLAAEIYAKAYNHEFGTDIKIVRFFNVYGHGQSNNFVIPTFINNALENKPLRVFGNGSQTRCFTYVEDIADGVFTVLEKGKTGEAYNIGNNKPATILELAKIIKELTNSKSEIIKAEFGKETRLKEREIEYRVPDISKMKELGWETRTVVREGIKKILELRKKN